MSRDLKGKFLVTDISNQWFLCDDDFAGGGPTWCRKAEEAKAFDTYLEALGAITDSMKKQAGAQVFGPVQ